MGEIKPKMVDGEPVCCLSSECPFWSASECFHVHGNGVEIFRGATCVPALRQQRDELKASLVEIDLSLKYFNQALSVTESAISSALRERDESRATACRYMEEAEHHAKGHRQILKSINRHLLKLHKRHTRELQDSNWAAHRDGYMKGAFDGILHEKERSYRQAGKMTGKG